MRTIITKFSNKVILCLFIAFIAYLMLSLNSCSTPTKLVIDEITVTSTENKAEITVEWETNNEVARATVEIFHNGQLYRSEDIVGSHELASKKLTLDSMFGKTDVKVTLHNNGASSYSETIEVSHAPSEINIAPITATLPTTLFTLNILDSIDHNPTYVWFKRPLVWNWSNLPENVSTFPVISYEDSMKHDGDAYKAFSQVADWTKELYEINPDIKFNMFYNDYTWLGFAEATIANGIPTDNYLVTLLTDGTATTNIFNDLYMDLSSNEAVTKSALMDASWTKFATDLANNPSMADDFSFDYEIDGHNYRDYAYNIVKNCPNVKWVLTSKDMFRSGDQAMIDAIKADNANFNQQYMQFNNKTAEQKQALKELYNFDDSLITEATDQGKKALVFIGTWTNSATSEPGLFDYAKALKKYYGDEYAFFYKGHPKFPPELSYIGDGKTRADVLEENDFIVLDASIPAELFYFFNDDIVMCGYQSTTFVTVDKVTSLFNRLSATTDQNAKTYISNFEFLISPVTTADADYGSLVTEEGTNYVLEFIPDDYDPAFTVAPTLEKVAIFNVENDTLTYYTYSNGSYEPLA